MRIQNREHYIISGWAGGRTTQIAIMPPTAVYGDRDFLWRVSSATVEAEESDFTLLPDYDRQILLLDGSIRLSHSGGPSFRLEPYRVHAFDGGEATRSWGRCRDFNLMLRKGKSSGRLRALILPRRGEAALQWESPIRGDLSRRSLLLYCANGDAAVERAGERLCCRGEESVWIEDAEGPALRLTARTPSVLIAAEVQY